MKKLIYTCIFLSCTWFATAQSGQFIMEVHSFKNDQPNPKGDQTIEYHFNGKEVAFVLPGDKTKNIMIMNPETRVTTTLTDDGKSKTGTRMKMPAIMLGKDDPRKSFTVTPTDEQKNINGYNCRKFLFESEEYAGYMWVTTDISWSYANLANTFSKMLGSKNASWVKLHNDFQGFPILTYQKEKNGKDSFETQYKNIQVGTWNKALFETAGYEITDLTQFQR